MLAATLGSPGVTKGAIASNLNLCQPLPQYIAEGSTELMVEEVSMVVMYTFANLNMANYPPGPATGLARACAGIQGGGGSPWGALSTFLLGYSLTSGAAAPGTGCYNLSTQLPSGPNATISAGDWSGVGSGQDGSSWDFETCTYLVEAIGANNITDMFLPREWSLDWLTQHCMSRFGVKPAPRTLPDLWGFDPNRLPHVTSRIIFTNGLNDGWSAGGIQNNLSDTLLAFNAPNGAHHSDLTHNWPSDADTHDVTAMRESVFTVLQGWLQNL